MSFLSTEYKEMFVSIQKKEDDENKLRLLNNLITKIKSIDMNTLSPEDKVKMDVLLDNIELEVQNLEYIIKESFEISKNQNKRNLYSNNDSPNNNHIYHHNYHHNFYHQRNEQKKLGTAGRVGCILAIIFYILGMMSCVSKTLKLCTVYSDLPSDLFFGAIIRIIFVMISSILGIIMCNNLLNRKAKSKTLAGVWALIHIGITEIPSILENTTSWKLIFVIGIILIPGILILYSKYE